MKTAYISPPSGNLDITIVRDKEPYCLVTLDLGIPNFTVFSLKMPVVTAAPANMTGLIAEGLAALLDEMSAFMISLQFEESIIVRIYATVLMTFHELTKEARTDAHQSEVGKDNTVVTFEGSFPLPQTFVNEVQQKVVTASSVIKRVPAVRRVELTVMKQNKVREEDVERVIRQYRGRSLKTQPKPMYVIVYDQKGRPTGTLSLGNKFKNNLLKSMKGSKK
jgi:hypothetical protein